MSDTSAWKVDEENSSKNSVGAASISLDEQQPISADGSNVFSTLQSRDNSRDREGSRERHNSGASLNSTQSLPLSTGFQHRTTWQTNQHRSYNGNTKFRGNSENRRGRGNYARESFPAPVYDASSTRRHSSIQSLTSIPTKRPTSMPPEETEASTAKPAVDAASDIRRHAVNSPDSEDGPVTYTAAGTAPAARIGSLRQSTPSTKPASHSAALSSYAGPAPNWPVDRSSVDRGIRQPVYGNGSTYSTTTRPTEERESTRFYDNKREDTRPMRPRQPSNDNARMPQRKMIMNTKLDLQSLGRQENSSAFFGQQSTDESCRGHLLTLSVLSQLQQQLAHDQGMPRHALPRLYRDVLEQKTTQDSSRQTASTTRSEETTRDKSAKEEKTLLGLYPHATRSVSSMRIPSMEAMSAPPSTVTTPGCIPLSTPASSIPSARSSIAGDHILPDSMPSSVCATPLSTNGVFSATPAAVLPYLMEVVSKSTPEVCPSSVAVLHPGPVDTEGTHIRWRKDGAPPAAPATVFPSYSAATAGKLAGAVVSEDVVREEARRLVAIPSAHHGPSSVSEGVATRPNQLHVPSAPGELRDWSTSSSTRCTPSPTSPSSSVSAPPRHPPTGLIDDAGRYDVSEMDVLSEEIWHYHNSMTQSEATLNRKLHLRDMLYYSICPVFPMCGLYVVGSSLNGFGNNSSDMDLCLMITNKDLDQKTDAVVVLNMILNALRSVEWVAHQQLILAKVPILRIQFTAPFADITVDLNANNSVAIKNTHLLCYYSSFDWRVRPLVTVVKEWAKKKGINDANRSSFTSYSLVLMVIHYLQCGVDHSVLPSLQTLYAGRFSRSADVRSLNVSIPLHPPPSEKFVFNDQGTLGELLIGFLEYYAEKFDYNQHAISVRQGKKMDRTAVVRGRPGGFGHQTNHWRSQWRCVCIEEPFTYSNTAHSVYDEMVFTAIKDAFREAYKELDSSRDLRRLLNCQPIQVQSIGNGAVVYMSSGGAEASLLSSSSSSSVTSAPHSGHVSSASSSSGDVDEDVQQCSPSSSPAVDIPPSDEMSCMKTSSVVSTDSSQTSTPLCKSVNGSPNEKSSLL